MENFVFSIHPKHAENIYSGKKLFEFRKVVPKTLIRGDRIWLYETTPVRAITGYFICDFYNYSEEFDDCFWNQVKHGAFRSSKKDLQIYFQNKRPKAIPVISSYKLSNPIPSNQVGWKRPPQNFIYATTIPNGFLHTLGTPDYRKVQND